MHPPSVRPPPTPEGLLVAKEPSLRHRGDKSRRWLSSPGDNNSPPLWKDDESNVPLPDPAKSSNVYNSHAGTGNPLNFFILRTFLLPVRLKSFKLWHRLLVYISLMHS